MCIFFQLILKQEFILKRFSFVTGILYFVFCTLNIVFQSCNERVQNPLNQQNKDSLLVNRKGTESTFEIATWNIENFPKSGKNTIESTSLLIQNLDIDLIAVQEIASINAFDSLMSKLDNRRGILSDDTYNSSDYQKTGIIYKTDIISIGSGTVKSLFENDSYAFPRPPLAAFVEVRDEAGIQFDFNIIVLHLKAYGDDESESRRRSACLKLKGYIDAEIAAGADPDFVVLGDWNDQLTDTGEDNVFLPFLDNPDDYLFLTGSLINQYSYIDTRYKSLIDHIMVSRNCLDEYGRGDAEVLYLDDVYSEYPAIISDHRPVLAIFKGFILN